MAELAIVGLGSNLGEPLANLRGGRTALERYAAVEAESSIYRTAPQGGPSGQPDYLNAVLVLRPAPPFAEPAALLEILLEIERAHGRLRRIVWEARTLDLDLLAYGRRVVDEPGLRVPHPRLLERAFVLAPLCEAQPGWRHPVSGVSACDELERVGSQGVERSELAWKEAG